MCAPCMHPSSICGYLVGWGSGSETSISPLTADAKVGILEPDQVQLVIWASCSETCVAPL